MSTSKISILCGVALAFTSLTSAKDRSPLYEVEDALPGLSFSQPIGISNVPGDQDGYFVIEKTGAIYRISNLHSSDVQKTLFLDLSNPRDGKLETSSECGVLGLAFPKDYATSRLFYVYYSLKVKGKLHQRLSRFQADASGLKASANDEQVLFSQEDLAGNHNGGDIQFGPDGYLYVGVGDGGSGNDQLDQARFIDKGFHAGILRLDVSQSGIQPNEHPGVPRDSQGKAYYTVPKDNPFIGARSHHNDSVDPKKVRTEFWAVGLRNPWRMWFDPKNGRLFAADVGQNSYEEINLIVKGGDYGWSFFEGTHDFQHGPGGKKVPSKMKPLDPIFEYPRSEGVSVTGGVVYRGKDFPDLHEKYVFADFGSGKIFALEDQGKKTWTGTTIARDGGIAGIALDPVSGEILFANMGQGKIKRLKKNESP